MILHPKDTTTEVDVIMGDKIAMEEMGDKIAMEEMGDKIVIIVINQNPEILLVGVNFLLILNKYKQFNQNYRVQISEIHTYLDM